MSGPVQHRVARRGRVPLPSGQALFIVEDETGSGKTGEAPGRAGNRQPETLPAAHRQGPADAFVTGISCDGRTCLSSRAHALRQPDGPD